MDMTNPQVTGAYAIISPGFGGIQPNLGIGLSPKIGMIMSQSILKVNFIGAKP